jgi:hypothetical protein
MLGLLGFRTAYFFALGAKSLKDIKVFFFVPKGITICQYLISLKTQKYSFLSLRKFRNASPPKQSKKARGSQGMLAPPAKSKNQRVSNFKLTNSVKKPYPEAKSPKPK